MSIGEQLFVRGISNNNDMWDDTQLIKAYERAMNSYKPVEMAKRIAMETNGNKPENKEKPKWRVGSACRAEFEGDGEDYEAYIVEMLEKGECIIKFVGYGDDAIVKLSDLKPSHGTSARSEQVYNITTEPSWKEIAGAEFGREESALDSASEAETMRTKGDDQAATSSRHSDPGKRKKNKSKKHKRKHHVHSSLAPTPELGRLPEDLMHQYADLPGLSGLPPLPPTLPSGDVPTDEQEILNSMLTAWYMSGYYSALYHTCLKKKSKKSS